MSVIHRTTLTPGKLELIAGWLPDQPWYQGAAGGRRAEPRLERAGGFRLDDPEGEVGIEIAAVRDTSGEQPVTYLVPMSYRGAPLAGAEDALLGTTEHGVLGTRWVYDAPHDPVMTEQLFALLVGEAKAQAQSESDTPDDSVGCSVPAPVVAALAGAARPVPVASVLDGLDRTDIGYAPDGGLELTVRVNRVLAARLSGSAEAEAQAEAEAVAMAQAQAELEVLGRIAADRALPGGGTVRDLFFTVLGNVARD